MNKLPQIDKWEVEQEKIASRVTIIPDNTLLLNECPGSHEFCYYNLGSSSSSSIVGEKLIGGVDVSFPCGNPLDGHGHDHDTAVAVYVITRNFQVIYQDSVVCTMTQPYISSFLAFREMEPIQTLINRQKRHRPELTPHVLLVDGNGIFHERRAGLATFVGVTMDVPTIGVAKTLYCMDGLSVDMVERQVALSLARLAQYFCCLNGTCNKTSFGTDDQEAVCIFCKTAICPRNDGMEMEETIMKSRCSSCSTASAALESIKGYCDGLSIPLMGKQGQILGAALVAHGGKIASGANRKKKKCGTKNPIYVSIGHGISLQEAVGLCCALSLARIPEPIRQADLIGRAIIKSNKRL